MVNGNIEKSLRNQEKRSPKKAERHLRRYSRTTSVRDPISYGLTLQTQEQTHHVEVEESPLEVYDDEDKIKWSREPIDDLLLTEIRVSHAQDISEWDCFTFTAQNFFSTVQVLFSDFNSIKCSKNSTE